MTTGFNTWPRLDGAVREENVSSAWGLCGLVLLRPLSLMRIALLVVLFPVEGLCLVVVLRGKGLLGLAVLKHARLVVMLLIRWMEEMSFYTETPLLLTSWI